MQNATKNPIYYFYKQVDQAADGTAGNKEIAITNVVMEIRRLLPSRNQWSLILQVSVHKIQICWYRWFN